VIGILRRVADFAWRHDKHGVVRFLRRLRSRFFAENSPNTTIAVSQLEDKLAFLRAHYAGRRDLRILEIGPWTGTHSLFIERFFEPAHLTFVERPGRGREDLFAPWIGRIRCSHRIVHSDLLLARELLEEPPFDVIFCLGVVYHNVEYFKTFHFLRRLLRDGGHLVLGTVLTYDRRPVVVIRYAKGQLHDFTRPSRAAVEVMLEMTGFEKVKSFDLPFPNQRGLFVYRAGEKMPVVEGACAFGGSIV
jgi:SAM-dependent methyltransferase